MPGNRKKNARKTGSRCSALAGQRPHACQHFTSCYGCCATEGFEILPLPPYSPYMAPSDFNLFQKLKSHLRGTQYGSNEGVIEAVNEYLGDQENAFYFEGRIRNLNRDGLSALP